MPPSSFYYDPEIYEDWQLEEELGKTTLGAVTKRLFKQALYNLFYRNKIVGPFYPDAVIAEVINVQFCELYWQCVQDNYLELVWNDKADNFTFRATSKGIIKCYKEPKNSILRRMLENAISKENHL